MKCRDWLRKKFYEKKLGKENARKVLAISSKRKRHKEFLIITQQVCQFCGTDKDLTIDHIIPVSVTKKKREKQLFNKQLLCRECNLKKGSKIL